MIIFYIVKGFKMSNFIWIATRTAFSSISALNFDNQLSGSYDSYHIVLKNILPDTANANLWLRLGTGAGSYISSGYIYQLCDINNNGSSNSYPGYTGSGFNQVLLTYANGNGISTDPTYGGLGGTIDLFISSGTIAVGSGVSQMSYESYNDTTNYANTTCSFQQPAANFTSIQLLMSTGNIASGSATLYGLTI